MQDPANGLPRIPIRRSRVKKGLDHLRPSSLSPYRRYVPAPPFHRGRPTTLPSQGFASPCAVSPRTPLRVRPGLLRASPTQPCPRVHGVRKARHHQTRIEALHLPRELACTSKTSAPGLRPVLVEDKHSQSLLTPYLSPPSLLTAASTSPKGMSLARTSLAPDRRNFWCTSVSSMSVNTNTGIEGLASCRSRTISEAPSSGRGMYTMAASMPPSAILWRPSATDPTWETTSKSSSWSIRYEAERDLRTPDLPVLVAFGIYTQQTAKESPSKRSSQNA